ncbi:hypothetical protein [Streptomyces sp. LN590]|uniref:hypothetical protein n=1 Tax=Streptomyces sp. LN590 TaxID=3112980 RepID=UPI003720CD04
MRVSSQSWASLPTGAPAYERTRNEPLRCAWRDLAGADAPDLRGRPRLPASDFGNLVPLTKDHNWAQELRDAGRQLKEWDHNSLTACLGDGDIGLAEVLLDMVAQFALRPDGVHHPLETYEPGPMEEAMLLALDAKEGAGSLVVESLAQGRSREASSDNATALVVRFPRPGA